MADPRNAVAFDELDAHYSTYKIDNSTITYDGTKARGADAAMLDKAVTISAAGTVALAADGEEVLGRLDGVESDNKARVQDGGYMKLPGGTGAALTLGKKIVGDLLVSAKGYIREVATGTAAELGVAKGEIIDAADTAAVVVKL